MPQLDKVTYFSQVFWLIFIFLTIYLVVVLQYLPKLAFITKFRILLKKRLVGQESCDADTHTFLLISDNVYTLRELNTSIISDTNEWISQSAESLKNQQSNSNTVLLAQAMTPAYNHLKTHYLNKIA
jgi:hypothetical protein